MKLGQGFEVPCCAGDSQLLGSDLSRWLPFSAETALGRLPAGITNGLPRWGAGLVLVSYAAAYVTVALASSVSRDVT